MSKKQIPLPSLSKREAQIMEVLFSKGECSVADIVEHMPDGVTRSAVRTFLALLEGKDCLSRRKQGREFLYTAATDKKLAAKSALTKVLDVFFNGSVSSAIAAQFSEGSDKIKEDELSELEELIQNIRKERK